MTLTSVSERYQAATNRLFEIDWTTAAASAFAVQLAVTLWYVYIDVFNIDPSAGTSMLSLSEIGTQDLLSTLILGFVISIFVLPFAFGFLWLVTPRLPFRKITSQTVGVWVIVCPGLLALILAAVIYYDGFGELVSFITDFGTGEIVIELLAWTVGTTLFALFVGGAYALASRTIRPSKQQTKMLTVLIVVLVAVPMAVGAVMPADELEDEFDFNDDTYASGDVDDLEQTDGEDDDQDGVDRDEDEGESGNDTETDPDDRPTVHDATLDQLTCETTADLPDDPETDYAVAGTESLEESEIDVQYADFDHVDGGETVTDRAYAIPFDGEIVGVKTTAESNSTEPLSAVYGDGIEVSTEMGTETRVWVDTINEDGEVVRHQFDLCPEPAEE